MFDSYLDKKLENEILDKFNKGKLHHAVLFSGIKGIGKSRFLSELSKKITNNDSDIENNPDILYIKRGLNQKKELRKEITIDEVRKVNDFLGLTYSISSNRVVLIDSVDELNKNSSNALLKNLEEPPKNTFFFVINHNENKILDTIRSRCSHIKIKSPLYKDFKDIILGNTLNLKDEEIKALFEISEGSIANALSLYQENFFETYEDFVKIVNKSEGSQSLIKFIDDIIKKDTEFLILENLINLFFSRVLKKNNISLEEEFFDGEEFLLNNYLVKFGIDKILNKYDLIKDKISKVIALNLDKKQFLINIFNVLDNVS